VHFLSITTRIPIPACILVLRGFGTRDLTARAVINAGTTPSNLGKTKMFETEPVTSGVGRCQDSGKAACTDRTASHDSHDWCLTVPASGPVKTATSYGKDRGLHSGWTGVVMFLVGAQILPSHHHVMQNSWVQEFDGDRGSLPRVTASRTKCHPRTSMQC
jgi:hypothetical protein